jgi:tetratricopeptide (TPR) repeat protein
MSSNLPPLAWRLDARLDEVPVDAEAFALEVDARVDDIATARSQPAKLLAMLVEVTPLLRIAGRIDEARKTASAAIALAELLEDPVAEFAGQLVLAQLMQRDGRYEIATALFDQLVARARSMPAHAASLHDVLFEAGRNLFQQGRYAQAARLFRESQSLRRESRRDDLLEITADAIRRCSAR